jgi:hypothetical protein
MLFVIMNVQPAVLDFGLAASEPVIHLYHATRQLLAAIFE